MEQEEGVNISANAVHPGVIMTNIFGDRTIIGGNFLNPNGRCYCLKTTKGFQHIQISQIISGL